jgi:hypothetical protein
MSAPAGSSHASKSPTPESREKLCNDYITHIESGLSDECFPECGLQTLKKYVADYPDDFDTDLIERSKRKRRLFRERMGRDGALGEIQGYNAKSWSFNIQNRFGWREKREDHLKVQRDPAADPQRPGVRAVFAGVWLTAGSVVRPSGRKTRSASKRWLAPWR